MAAEDDDRYSSKRAVCMAAHRTLLLSPVLGVGCKLARHCVPVLEFPMGHPSTDLHDTDANSLFTWKALNSVFVTLLKDSHDATVIYMHPSDMHYHASPLGSLGTGCPVGTALLAQIVLDRNRLHDVQQGGWVLSILIFDAMQIGTDDFVKMQVQPRERYARMRALCTHSDNVLTSPAMKLQWAGEYGALRNFCSGPGSQKNIDHIPDGYFKYTRKHPCEVVSVE